MGADAAARGGKQGMAAARGCGQSRAAALRVEGQAAERGGGSAAGWRSERQRIGTERGQRGKGAVVAGWGGGQGPGQKDERLTSGERCGSDGKL
jgi:hypothetical protein